MRLLLLILALFFSPPTQAQTGDAATRAAELVREGIRLHDAEKYEDAIRKYEEAAQLDPDNEAVAYETAYTYSAMGKSKEALRCADRAIAAGGRFTGPAYMIKGNLLDDAGHFEEAVRTYRKGLRSEDAAKSHYMLHYNLALAYTRHDEPDKAVAELMDGIKLRPDHASSHLLLATLMEDQRERIPAILALYHFLLLEPDTRRSPDALSRLDALIGYGVTKRSSTRIDIVLPSKEGDEDDPFRMMEMTLSMRSAIRISGSNGGKGEVAQFAELTQSLFKMLHDLERKKVISFWWDAYGHLFTAVEEKGHTEAFAHYIRLSEQRTNVVLDTWLQTNEQGVLDFLKWFDAQMDSERD